MRSVNYKRQPLDGLFTILKHDRYVFVFTKKRSLFLWTQVKNYKPVIASLWLLAFTVQSSKSRTWNLPRHSIFFSWRGLENFSSRILSADFDKNWGKTLKSFKSPISSMWERFAAKPKQIARHFVRSHIRETTECVSRGTKNWTLRQNKDFWARKAWNHYLLCILPVSAPRALI